MKSQKKKSSEENKTGEKMIIKLKEETVNEIIKDELKKEKKERPLIFNNKKNNKDCSDLLKNAISLIFILLPFIIKYVYCIYIIINFNYTIIYIW